MILNEDIIFLAMWTSKLFSHFHTNIAPYKTHPYKIGIQAAQVQQNSAETAGAAKHGEVHSVK